ncbi:MAG TPA: acyl-CoA ligase (AMP-forming), exosortase A system-associated [Candidatus Accumulibacter phosphatis]|nr:MAG: Long-chain-fatty-acid--CoA ligase [Candidatus Accumulibacter sp. SK-11]HAY28673.1 acyl-CoA ligase (AMP-forming), exosortase A system-associated [Accumulibacter sp.]HCN69608.1 acyl-CoA ligase (AMP-forming), exosortase A system-associated [Accumulibacter sp.]HRL76644.1 acyl-CoA ligase (AMP-forming), exosortase A system-associated [Candidatus Accumulibacter phosphatis]HRQ95794.1 acyl-CoA ligase (AMP-forming), exosortase A system-associated [Candidatus Accumulibacter phosphatis]
MNDASLLADLIRCSAHRQPEACALTYGKRSMSYGELQHSVTGFASGLIELGLQRGERVAIYLEKRLETVVASFGATAAGCVFVPLNPLLKAEQVAYIMRDCNVRALVSSGERLALLAPVLPSCHDLRHLISVSGQAATNSESALACVNWDELLRAAKHGGHRVIDGDMAAILYTSGSTGKPKGVVLSHRNMVAGAVSVAGYLENSAEDTLLAALPLSFDAGFSQLTTGFHVGARVVLLNYLLPQDVLKTLARERVSGLTAVPPLYIQLSQLEWPAIISQQLRYFANTGGRMPRETLAALRARLPNSKPYLMYGLTEAFRSTFLPPDEVDRRPDSIGKAIPNAEILVLREDGSPCVANEPGELVHRGALVGLGYWNDREKTSQRYRPLPAGVAGRDAGLVLPEIAVFSGDTVRIDEDGFIYFIGRRDEMIKTSGYRVSPTEVEEIAYATRLVGECVAFGVDHPILGQSIQLIATAAAGDSLDCDRLLAECRQRMPAYMVPAGVSVRREPLPRNPNGKLDRKTLAAEFLATAEACAAAAAPIAQAK